ncbi:CDP-alcohol phosphatidyltransferase family protein [Candidatus Woesearchaeota archaeon]|nr:CDP-alcohol phosphatidyltransferase family protein [Candidatus Woesearchaeota archaeon]
MKKLINIPNIITFIRFLLSPVFIYFLIKQNTKLALSIVAINIIADGLDGFVARILKQETKFGRIFDLLTDAFFFLICLIGLTYYKYIELSITLIIILSGLIKSVSFIIRKNIVSSRWSKLSGLLLSILIICSLILPILYQIIKWPIVLYNILISLIRIYQAIIIRKL